MTQDDWLKILNMVPRKAANPFICKLVRETLAGVDPTNAISTTQLTERLWPEAEARGITAIKARGRLMNTLVNLGPNELQDCMTLAPPRDLYGRATRPRTWHQPKTGTLTANADKFIHFVMEQHAIVGDENLGFMAVALVKWIENRVFLIGEGYAEDVSASTIRDFLPGGHLFDQDAVCDCMPCLGLVRSDTEFA